MYDGSYSRQNDKIDEIVLEFEKIIYSNIEESYRTCEQIDLNEYTIRPVTVKQTTVESTHYQATLTNGQRVVM